MTTEIAPDMPGLEAVEERGNDVSAYAHQRKQTLFLPESGGVIAFVEKMLLQAIDYGASDIHIEKYRKNARLRYRLDGVLNEIDISPLLFNDYSGIAARIKLLAKLDIAERRMPQDGRFSFTHGNGVADIRVSIVPIISGERIVLRILNSDMSKPDINGLGMNRTQADMFSGALNAHQGMILVTGPTGSGKTTTLYAAVQSINTAQINILTVEDPVEYRIEGIGQVEVKESIGLGFSEVLRAFLRQDPELILVGEIRDFETADIAMKAALTGHLVMSTLHTGNAAETVTRMLNIGISGYLIMGAINLIVCQRLVRKLCPRCKEICEGAIGEAVLREADIGVYKAVGCKDCHFTGYAGRCAVYEMVAISDDMRRTVSGRGVSSGDIVALVAENRLSSLQDSGLRLLKDGLISLEEYARVL